MRNKTDADAELLMIMMLKYAYYYNYYDVYSTGSDVLRKEAAYCRSTQNIISAIAPLWFKMHSPNLPIRLSIQQNTKWRPGGCLHSLGALSSLHFKFSVCSLSLLRM